MSKMINNATVKNASPELLAELLTSVAPREMYSPPCRANTARSLAALRYKPTFARQERTLVLALFAGSRDERHEVRVGKDGNCYCTCQAWKRQSLHPADRVCKHIAAVFGIPGTWNATNRIG
jgi:hypothetical protein